MTISIENDSPGTDGVVASVNDSATRWRAAWRWHFYAAIFVLPILLTLAVTGFVILIKPTIERWAYGDMLYVETVVTPVSFGQQQQAVLDVYPEAFVDAVVPPRDADRATQFDITAADGKSLSVYVNPADARVLGHIDNDTRIDFVATQIHGTRWMGRWGDYLVEIAGGWTLVMALTGLYLWFPRKRMPNAWRRAFIPRFREKGRRRWRDMHSTIGAIGAPVLVFLAITGLPWTGFWGAVVWGPLIDRLDSGYNFPAEDPVSGVVRDAQSVETPGLQISWANERRGVPKSDPNANIDGGATTSLTLERVAERGRELDMLPGFAIGFPADETGVFTLSNAWPSAAQDERAVYLDQYTGEVLDEVSWEASWGNLAKITSWGINAHMGRQVGVVNGIVMGAVSIGVMFSVLSAPIMYWKRRPRGSLGFPRRPYDAGMVRGAVVIAAVLGVLFPLLGVSMLAVWVVDHFLVRRAPQLRAIFGMK
jgi:uncharacterized iron-regulated membrane protein